MRFLLQRAKWREEGDTREPVRRGKPVGRSKAIHEHLATCTQDKCSQKRCEVQQDWHNVTMAPGIAQPCSQKWFKMVQELGIQKSVMGKFNVWPSSRLFFFLTTYADHNGPGFIMSIPQGPLHLVLQVSNSDAWLHDHLPAVLEELLWHQRRTAGIRGKEDPGPRKGNPRQDWPSTLLFVIRYWGLQFVS